MPDFEFRERRGSLHAGPEKNAQWREDRAEQVLRISLRPKTMAQPPVLRSGDPSLGWRIRTGNEETSRSHRSTRDFFWSLVEAPIGDPTAEASFVELEQSRRDFEQQGVKIAVIKCNSAEILQSASAPRMDLDFRVYPTRAALLFANSRSLQFEYSKGPSVLRSSIPGRFLYLSRWRNPGQVLSTRLSDEGGFVGKCTG